MRKIILFLALGIGIIITGSSCATRRGDIKMEQTPYGTNFKVKGARKGEEGMMDIIKAFERVGIIKSGLSARLEAAEK